MQIFGIQMLFTECIGNPIQGFPFGIFWGRPPHAPPPAPPAHIFDGGAWGAKYGQHGGAWGGLGHRTWGGMGGLR